MLKDTEVRYRADGSIDTGYYIRRGGLNSEAELRAGRRLAKTKLRWTRQALNSFNVPTLDFRKAIP